MNETLSADRFEAIEALPGPYLNLFERVGAKNFQLSPRWFGNLVRTTLQPQQGVRLYGVGSTGAARALLPTRLSPADGLMSVRKLEGFTAPYTTEFGIVADEADAGSEPVLRALARALAADRSDFDLLSIDGLCWPKSTLDCFAGCLRDAGLVAHAHFHFGNWYEDVTEMDFASYRRTLPSALRRLINRIGRDAGPAYRMVEDRDCLDREVVEYERLSLLRWGYAEPDETFIRGLVHAAFEAGALRFGILEFDGKRVASQIWLVAGGRATIFKLAHNPDLKRSFGSTLTLRMMQHVMEVDGVSEVDYGRGDDEYKKTWLPRRRERWTITAYNPSSVRGGAMAADHFARTAAKRLLRRPV